MKLPWFLCPDPVYGSNEEPEREDSGRQRVELHERHFDRGIDT